MLLALLCHLSCHGWSTAAVVCGACQRANYWGTSACPARTLLQEPLLEQRSNHIASILYELHWLPVKMCIDYKILSLVVYSCRHGTASQYLQELIPCYLLVPVSVALQPVSSLYPQCWPWKQQQQQNVESEHFPVLHQNCGTVCPALWEDVWHKAWRPTCFRELDQLRLCTSDSAIRFSFLLLLLFFFFFFFWNCSGHAIAVWASICALQVFIIIVRIPVLSAQWQTTGLAQCWYQSQYLLLVLWHHLAAV